MTPVRSLLCGVSMLALAACASKGTPPPQISYDSGDFTPAVAEAEPPKPVRIVTVPEPLPLPGQLKPLPDGKPARPDKRPPKDRVDAANKAARLEPTKEGYVNAVQVYPFTRGALGATAPPPAFSSGLSVHAGRALSALRGAGAGERHRAAAG